MKTGVPALHTSWHGNKKWARIWFLCFHVWLKVGPYTFSAKNRKSKCLCVSGNATNGLLKLLGSFRSVWLQALWDLLSSSTWRISNVVSPSGILDLEWQWLSSIKKSGYLKVLHVKTVIWNSSCRILTSHLEFHWDNNFKAVRNSPGRNACNQTGPLSGGS